MSEARDKVDNVHQSRQSAYAFFKAKRDAMAENSRFLRLDQYSTAQLQKMAGREQVPYVMDYINNSVNTLQGIQRDRRTEIFYYPSEGGDDVKTEVLNVVKDDCLRQNNYTYLESDMFLSGIVEKVGAIGYEWSLEKNKNGALKLFKIPPRCLSWDINARQFDKDDATWIGVEHLYGKRQLKALRPEKAKLIDELSIGMDVLSDLNLDPEYISTLMGDKEVLLLIKHFEKTWEQRWFIRNRSNGFFEAEYYASEKEAVAEIKDRLAKLEAMSNEAASRGVQLPPFPEYDTKMDRTPMVRKTEVVLDQLIDEELIEEPFYPVSFYHPYWYEGDYWSPVDVMKDGQRYFNKMFSMLDHWIGTMSKGLLLIDDSVPEPVVKEVIAKFGKTGGAMRFPDPEGNIKLLESKGPAPQLFSMMQTAQQNLEDNSGGRNFQGKKETASESGVAVRTRIEQGSLAGFVVYDNLRRTKIDVGEKMAWYLTHFMKYPSVVRIMGEELVQGIMEKFNQTEGRDWFKRSETNHGVGFLEVNTTKSNTIDGLKVDVIVDEAKWSVSKAESTLQQVNLLMQSNPVLAEVFPPDALINLLPLPFSEKQKAQKGMEELLKHKMEKEKAEMQKPPSVSASLGDALELPPEGAAQFVMKYFGVQIDPNGIQNKDAQKIELERVKGTQELIFSQQNHELEMRKQQEQMILDRQKFGQKMEHDAIAGEQKIHFAQRTQAMKESTNEKD